MRIYRPIEQPGHDVRVTLSEVSLTKTNGRIALVTNGSRGIDKAVASIPAYACSERFTVPA